MDCNYTTVASLPVALTDNVTELATNLSTSGVKCVLDMPLSAGELTTMSTEAAAKLVPNIIKEEAVLADAIANTGANVAGLAVHTSKTCAAINSKASIALAAGAVACVGVYWLWKKFKNQKEQINSLEMRLKSISEQVSANATAISALATMD